MSLKNLLDLRKKVSPQIQIVERIIFQKRSWKGEALRTLMVALVATAVIWGISNADTLVSSVKQVENTTKNFSAIGLVSNITDTTLSLDNARGSNDKSQTSYTFNTDTVTKIETKSYVPLTLSDINVGDKIVVQGVDDNGLISIKRIISFSATSSKEKVATTTPEVIATTTATTTEAATTTNTSTSSDEATTSVQVSTTTEQTEATSTPTIVEKVIEVVKDAVNTVVDAVTPDPKPETQTQPEVQPETQTATPPAPEAPAPAPEAQPAPLANDTPAN